MNEVLRSAMTARGLTVESLAQQTGVDRKTVGRWLSPGRVPHARTRSRAAAVLGLEVGELWPNTGRRRDPLWFVPWAQAEREATSLRWFEALVVPGLLQTEAYARAVLTDAGLMSRDAVEQRVRTRMDRRAILAGNKPPQFTAVLDEGVLRRPVGSSRVMRDQVQAIITACEEPHVRVHVVPSTAGAYAGLNGPFVLAAGPGGRLTGYLDTQLDGQVVDSADKMEALQAAWESVRGEALPHRQSIDLMTEVAETWTT
ncbi:transcriptional regulator with XRE-family HTH domain [Micromonospora pisi]|uniref:Transcriptional regulator with XRE-family HTH domain n=1 Tax=Micromonospora pisi TaxID=589240 RepID=A0A495JTS8_9ACTN|nr:helix-turn-helix transcriptional regulator [Micromonospora pisi]RKR91519.1 transcriptional regulator with XRE-family HTH domain [Micromonospora pisi]